MSFLFLKQDFTAFLIVTKHFLLLLSYVQDVKVKVTQSCPTLQNHGLYSPWNSPGQNTGVDSLSLLQGIFPTQGLNPGLLHCRRILYQLSYEGSPRKMKVVHFLFATVSHSAICTLLQLHSKHKIGHWQYGMLLVLWYMVCYWQYGNMVCFQNH